MRGTSNINKTSTTSSWILKGPLTGSGTQRYVQLYNTNANLINIIQVNDDLQRSLPRRQIRGLVKNNSRGETRLLALSNSLRSTSSYKNKIMNDALKDPIGTVSTGSRAITNVLLTILMDQQVMNRNSPNQWNSGHNLSCLRYGDQCRENQVDGQHRWHQCRHQSQWRETRDCQQFKIPQTVSQTKDQDQKISPESRKQQLQ